MMVEVVMVCPYCGAEQVLAEYAPFWVCETCGEVVDNRMIQPVDNRHVEPV